MWDGKGNGAESVTVVDRRMADSRFAPVLTNAGDLPFAEAFDIVTATDIMEHVLNVGSFISSLNGALVVGGDAYVRVPYPEDLLPYSPHLDCEYRFVSSAKLRRLDSTRGLRECRLLDPRTEIRRLLATETSSLLAIRRSEAPRVPTMRAGEEKAPHPLYNCHFVEPVVGAHAHGAAGDRRHRAKTSGHIKAGERRL
jgi:hypothetical protein